MKRTTAWCFIICILMLNCCQINNSLPAPDQAVPVVTVGFAARPAQAQVFQPLIDDFNAQNTTVHVQFVPFDPTEKPDDRVIQSLARAADTAYVDDLFFTADITNGDLANLSPFIATDPAFNRDDYFPGILDLFGSEDHIVMVPYALSIPRLAYNKTLFAQAGIPEPDPTWTWDEILIAAEQLVRRLPDKVAFGIVDEGLAFSTDLAQRGFKSWEVDSRQVRLDQPAIVDAFARAYDLAQRRIVYDPQMPHAPDPQPLIADGKVGIWRTNLLTPTSNDWKPPFDIGLASLPIAPYYFFGVTSEVQGFIMSSGSQHPQEAWRWLSFLSHQVVPRIDADPDLAATPMRRSIADQSGYWGQLHDETRSIIQRTLEQRSQLIPLGKEGSSINIGLALDQAKQAIFQQGVAPEIALSQAQASLEQLVVQATPIPSPIPFTVPTPIPLTDPPGVTRIRFSVSELSPQSVQVAAHAFEAEHPDQRIQIITASSHDIATEAQRVDCFSGSGAITPINTRLLLDLQPLMDAYPSFNRADYPDVLLSSYRFDNQVIGLPNAAYLHILLYNKALFAHAGIPTPQAGWSPDQFLQVAQQLTRYESGQTSGFIDYEPRITIPFFLGRFGASWVRYDADALQPNFDDPAVIEGTRYYLNLLQSTGTPADTSPSAPTLTSEQAIAAVSTGKAGMLIDTSARAIDDLPETVGVAAPPLGAQGATTSDVFPIGLFIAANTQHADICWRWLLFLNSRPEVLQPGMLPARISVAQALPTTSLSPIYTAYVAALKHVRPQIASPISAGRVDMDFYWYFAALHSEQQSLEQRLHAAQQKTEQLLTCISQGTAQDICIKQIDPQRVR